MVLTTLHQSLCKSACFDFTLAEYHTFMTRSDWNVSGNVNYLWHTNGELQICERLCRMNGC